MEKTLVFIKPEHVDIADIIFHELDELGSRVYTTKVENVPEDIIRRHYEPLRDKYYYGWLVNSLIGKTIVLAVYEGEDIIGKVLRKVGDKDPIISPHFTIRGRYSKDSLELAKKEERAPANVIHRSDSIAEAVREINVWKAYLGLEI